MKKIFSLLLAVLLFVFLFNPFKSFAGVEGSSLDQSYSEEAGAYGFLIDNNPKMIQTFKPLRPIITSIDVDLKNRKAGSTITLTIVDEMDNTVSGPYSHELTGPDGMNAWETFSFTSPYVGVTPGTTYGIKLSINDTQTRWWYNNIFGNVDGYFKATSAPYDWDALYKVYSKNEDVSSPTTPEPTSSTTESAASSSSENIDSNNNNSSANNTQQNIDQSISRPVLKTLSVNNKLVDLNATDTITLNSGDEMILTGTSDKETAVVIYIGTKTFTAKVDKEGNWKVKITYTELPNGTFDVLAQAQKNDKFSTKTNFYKVATNKTATTSQKVINSFWNTTNMAIIIGALVLIAGVLIIYFLRKKMKKNN